MRRTPNDMARTQERYSRLERARSYYGAIHAKHRHGTEGLSRRNRYDFAYWIYALEHHTSCRPDLVPSYARILHEEFLGHRDLEREVRAFRACSQIAPIWRGMRMDAQRTELQGRATERRRREEEPPLVVTWNGRLSRFS